MSEEQPVTQKRTRTKSTKLLQSDEPLAKKLKGGPGEKKKDKETTQPTTSTHSTPAVSRQPSMESPTPSGSYSRQPSIDIEDDVDNGIEIRGPVPRRKDRALEASDGSDDDDDDEGSEGEDTSGKGDGNSDDPQAKLDKLYQTYKSPIYVFFLPPKYKAENGKQFHVFQCAAKNCKCSSRFVNRNIDTANATSTSNLRSHANKCWGEDVVKLAMGVKSIHEARKVLKDKKNLRDSSIRVAFQMAGQRQVTYSANLPTKLETRVNHVKWVCEDVRPFSTVEDKGYHRNMKTGPGRQDTYIPSASTVSRDVKMVFKGAREKISHLLRNHKGSLHFATDCWTSPNRRAYMAVTVQLEKGGKIESWLLDIVEVARRHTGRRLAVEFTKILQEFDIIDKILSITCDNATNNDVMVDSMYKTLAKFQGDASRVRCFAHVVNLVAKSILAQFELPKKKKNTASEHDKRREESGADVDELDDLDDDGFEVEEAGSRDDVAQEADIDRVLAGGDEALAAKLAEIRKLAGGLDKDQQKERSDEAPLDHVNDEEDEGWVDERWDLEPEELKELAEEVMPTRGLLVKLRKISFAVKNSPTVIAPRWRKICKELRLAERNIPTDVRTRWNSTYDLLEFAIEYQKAIDALTGERTLKLRKYEIDSKEWGLAVQLCKVLEVFKEATLFFSEDETPHITSVIPSMDHLDEMLASTMVDPKVSSGIRSAVRLGKQTLNRYYSKTDQSELYRIAMVLDPRYKTAYFRQANWDEAWVTTALNLVKDAFKDYKEPDVEIIENEQEKDDDVLMVENPQLRFTPKPKTSNMFRKHLAKSQPVKARQQVRDELEHYLETGPESLVYVDPETKEEIETSPLEWWLSHRDLYPRLSRMALDYLSIPATSVDVERVFSKGRMVLSYLRNRLSVQTTRSILCINEWLSKGFLKDKEMEAWLRGLQEIDYEDEDDVADGWDNITGKSSK